MFLPLFFFTRVDVLDSALLLCSDGLSNMVEDEEIEKIIKSGRELPKIAMDLIERANRNGGKDNIAVVLAQPLTGEVEQC